MALVIQTVYYLSYRRRHNLKSGYETLLLIHIEVESRAENQALHANFAKRMYEYYVLIQQYFAKYKIYSLGILLNIVRMLGEYGYDKQTRRNLLNLVDWIIKLPKDLQPQFLNSIAHKDKNMEYVNSFVRYGMEQGLEKGLEKGQISGQINMLLSMLEHRFGNLPIEIRSKINKASAEQIKDWSLKLIEAEKLEDIFI